MSALPLKADSRPQSQNVRFGPIADSCIAAIFVFVSMASSSFEDRALDGGSAPIHRELRALDEAGAICREEDNGFGNLIGCGWTPSWCLSG